MAADSRNRHSGETGLPTEVVEDILSSARRRAMLSYLAARSDPVVVEDLAEAVAERADDAGVDGVDPATRRAVRDDIYERHLPKLTATGVVEYDSMRGTVWLVNRAVVRELDEQ